MSVTLCIGNNCKVRDTCKRYIKNYAGPVTQMLPVIDWSSYGSGKADSNGVEVSYTCGDNSENYPLLDPIETDEDVMAAALSKLGIPTYNEDGTRRSMELIVADLARAQWLSLLEWGDTCS